MVRHPDNPTNGSCSSPSGISVLRAIGYLVGSRVVLNVWQDLHVAVGLEWRLPKQVNELIRELEKEGTIIADKVLGRRFGAAANPVLRPRNRRRDTSPGGTGRGTGPNAGCSPSWYTTTADLIVTNHWSGPPVGRRK